MESKVGISLLILTLAIVGIFALTIQMTVNAATGEKQTNTVQNLIENIAANEMQTNSTAKETNTSKDNVKKPEENKTADTAKENTEEVMEELPYPGYQSEMINLKENTEAEEKAEEIPFEER